MKENALKLQAVMSDCTFCIYEKYRGSETIDYYDLGRYFNKTKQNEIRNELKAVIESWKGIKNQKTECNLIVVFQALAFIDFSFLHETLMINDENTLFFFGTNEETR